MPITKTCTKCGETKVAALFARRGKGLQPKCKACNAAYRQENRERVSATKQAWATRNIERSREIKRLHYARNREHCSERQNAWRRAHPEHRISDNLNRRVAHRNATPAWANLFFIDEIYALARLRTKLLTGGVKWSVDHVIPLRSKTVCGLHTHDNLRVVPALLNVRKGNRLEVA
jgi:hypothetical protein